MQQSRSNANTASQHVSSFTRLAKQAVTLQGTTIFKHKSCLMALSATLALAIPQIMCHNRCCSVTYTAPQHDSYFEFKRLANSRMVGSSAIPTLVVSQEMSRHNHPRRSVQCRHLRKQQGRAETHTGPKHVSYFTRRTNNMAIVQELTGFRLEPSPDFPRE